MCKILKHTQTIRYNINDKITMIYYSSVIKLLSTLCYQAICRILFKYYKTIIGS